MDVFATIFMMVIFSMSAAGFIAWYGLAAGWWERPWESWEHYQATTKGASEHRKYKKLAEKSNTVYKIGGKDAV